METNYYPKAERDSRKPKGIDLQQSINTNKAHKAIRVNAERVIVEGVSDKVIVGQWQKSARQAKNLLRNINQ